MTLSNWFYRPQPRPGARARLFCFHHAGAGAAVYRLWPAHLPPTLDLLAVHLPGREMRIREPMLHTIPEIADAVARELTPHLDLPFAFFGHSMGAVVALEVTRELQRRGLRVPDHLVVSGRRPPHVPDPRPPFGHLPNRAFADEVNRRYNGSIPAALLEDEDVMEMVLSSLRVDITALERHQPARRPPLDVPITVFGGIDDPLAPPDQLSAWADETVHPVRTRFFPGDHFYLKPQAEPLLAALGSTLAPLLAEAPVARSAA